MIENIVTLCFKRRSTMIVAFGLLLCLGWYCWLHLPLEAYPDIAPVTSQVITQVAGLAAAEVEQQITIPLERMLIGTAGVDIIRSRSIFGLSLITIVFRDGIDDYWSRERLLETLEQMHLPYGAEPRLDPLTSP